MTETGRNPDLPPGWPAMSLAQAHALLTQPGSPFEMETAQVRGLAMKVWKNAPPTLRDLFLMGQANRERTFLVYEEERVTYDAFMRATTTLAHALVNQGVKKGDRVAVVFANVPEWPVAFFAALLAGAIATPLNAWWTGAELEYALQDSGAKVLLCDAERFKRMQPHLAACPDLTRVYVSRAPSDLFSGMVARLEDVIGPTSAWGRLPVKRAPAVDIQPDDDATIFYTSGTTGHPKGAVGTHRNALSSFLISGLSMARNFLRRGEKPPAPDPAAPQRRSLLSIPFFHVTGCMALLLPTIFQGAMIVTMRRWDAEEAMQIIEREKINIAGGVPTIAWQLVEHPARAKYDLTSLETVTYGGAPAAPELVRKLKEAFPKSDPSTGWGMTETSATFTHHGAEDYVNRPGSAGPAPPVCEMKIVGANGEALPVGEVGELWARGPNVLRAYWNKPEATAETFIDGWVRTGDLAKLDEEGFLYIVDRAKDMILRGGENIYSAEVEAVLFQHPAVMDAALVPIPHRVLGEEPGAVVTLIPGASVTEDELKAFVAARQAAFKVPVQIIFQRDMLPRNANGKIMKAELKALFTPRD